MGVLKNIKHEAFAQGIAKGMSADAAYAEAGYKPNRGNAARMKTNESIVARIKELTEQAARRSAKSLDDVIAEYERIAFADLSEFLAIDDDGEVSFDMAKPGAGLVFDVEQTKRRSKKAIGEPSEEIVSVTIKPKDRLKALEKLGAYLGMGDKAANEATNDLAEAIREINARGSSAPLARDRDA